MVDLHVFANSGDPDQRPHSATFAQGLLCLPIILLGLQTTWIKDPLNNVSVVSVCMLLYQLASMVLLKASEKRDMQIFFLFLH